MHTFTRWFLMAMCVAMPACAGIESSEPLQTATSVDLARYAGTWYEIARLPMWFQRHCVDSKAVYTSRADGERRVVGFDTQIRAATSHARAHATLPGLFGAPEFASGLWHALAHHKPWLWSAPLGLGLCALAVFVPALQTLLTRATQDSPEPASESKEAAGSSPRACKASSAGTTIRNTS